MERVGQNGKEERKAKERVRRKRENEKEYI